MHVVEQKTNVLEEKRATLETLTKGRSFSAEKLGELKAKRSAAVRRLAMGDEAERKVIKEYEAEIETAALKVEGFDGLIAEAEEAVRQAISDVDKANNEQQAALADFIRAHLDAERDAAEQDLPDRIKRIGLAYVNLALELGALQVDVFRWPGGSNVFAKAIQSFHFAIEDVIKASPIQRFTPSSLGLEVHAFLPRDEEHAVPGFFEFKRVMERVKQRDSRRLTDLFHNQAGGEDRC
jgi:hypothetical protein